MTPRLAILLMIAAVAAAAAGHDARRQGRCHNATGTCLAHGFACISGQVVPHRQRCDGVDDCADGSDEFLCNDPDGRPVHERPAARLRRALAQGQYSCARCTCYASTLVITSTNPWFPFAISAYLDPAGLLTGGSSQHAGQPCSRVHTTQLTIRTFRKDRYCRGPLCCLRQLSCDACSGGFNPTRRCIEV